MALDVTTDPSIGIDPRAYSFEAPSSGGPQTDIKNNFSVSAQLQQTGPTPDPSYGEQTVSGQVHGQEFLTQCENTGMLEQCEMSVSGTGAELFGAACEGISRMTTEVSAEFLQSMNVSVTPLEPETPTCVYNQSLTI